MSFEVRDLMVKLLPLDAHGCEHHSCAVYETTPGDCTPCQTTGLCPEPVSQCPDCKETPGETCDNTCKESDAKAYGGQETGLDLESGLVLLQRQLRQALGQSG